MIENWVGHFYKLSNWVRPLLQTNLLLSNFYFNSTPIYVLPLVNFINILRTNFWYEHCFGRFSLVTCTYKKLPKQRLYVKFVRKMLMKLTPFLLSQNVRSHNHARNNFKFIFQTNFFWVLKVSNPNLLVFLLHKMFFCFLYKMCHSQLMLKF